MDVGAGGLREALKKIFEQFSLEIAYAASGDFRAADAVWAAAEIDRGGGERFVHGHQKISGAEDAALGAQGFLYGLTKHDTDIFYSVVLIDVEIAAGIEIHVEGAVACYEFEHVIEETDAGVDVGFSAAVENEMQADIGF